MSDREYLKSIIDLIPEEHLGEVIEYLMNLSEEDENDEMFELVSEHILEKYRKAFEELAK